MARQLELAVVLRRLERGRQRLLHRRLRRPERYNRTSSLANVPANSVYTIDGIHYWKVASSITENAFMSYTFSTTNRILDGGTIRAGVNNLSNRLPPLTSDPAGYDATVYQSLAQGRVWSLAITKKF